jgi:TolA-binding protein
MNRFCLILSIFVLVSCHSSDPVQREFFQAEKLVSEGRYTEAIDVYERYMDRHPKHGTSKDAALRIAVILQFPDTPKSLTALERRAELFVGMGNYLAALAEYQRLSSVVERVGKPADQYAYQAASLYLKMRDYDQAVVELVSFSKQFPKSEWVDEALFDLGETYFYQKEYKESAAAYKKLLKKYSKSPLKLRAEFNLALALEELGSWARAQKLYEGLLETYPNREVIEKKILQLQERRKRTRRG